ncbi:MAG: 4Fe-4S dicluster domain-containing protein [Ruminococcaceae bacterium]|nr:4Fe-4S dicluster domain-containing protein [Oscillospiraceae bacterium]
MAVYKHSVSLEPEKCKGCTMCLKHCPTEAIRIRDGRAVINSEICIDCGECIRVCPHKAKKAIFDKLEDIAPKYKWKIALPAPSLYGQFENLDDLDYVLQGLLECGFDEVFEVSRAAEIVSEYTRRYMRKKDVQRPVISSACPTIVRLIRLRFPYLCDNVMPILPPVEVASRMAKENAQKAHPELSPDEICTVFISPCPAKASYVKNGISQNASSIDYVVSMSEMYFKLIGAMKAVENPEITSTSGTIGISWASSGGESSALFNDRYLAADGIDNAIKVLDEIETGNFPYLEFVELNACPGGCVGGAATVENPYIARVRLQTLRRYLPISQNRLEKNDEPDDYVPDHMQLDSPITYAPAMRLNANRGIAMQMMSDIEKVYELLPEIDCGSCGAPTCRAFAEDVVKGECKIEECVVYMRERLRAIWEKQGEEGK